MMMTQGSYTFVVVVEPIVHLSVYMVNFFVNILVVVLVAVSYVVYVWHISAHMFWFGICDET